MREELHFAAQGEGRSVRCFGARPDDIDDFFRAAVARAGNAEAIVDCELRVTYADLDSIVDRVAANLAASGAGRGDRVAISLINRPEFIYVLLACARLGAISVPMNVRMRGPEVAYVLEHSGAKVLVHEAAEAAQVPPAERLPDLETRFVCGGVAAGGMPFETLLEEASPPPPVRIDEEDTAVILYTSGTTGRAKGARLTHLGVVHAVMHWQACCRLRDRDRAVLAVPASHVAGLVGVLLTTIHLAGCLVLMRGFSAADFLMRAAEERCSYTVLVPAMYKLCLMDPGFDDVDLSAWRVGIYGGAPMPESTIEELAARLPGLAIANAYGATETTTVATVMPHGHTPGRIDSVGRVVPCADLRIMDEAGREVPRGEAGEVWIAGPNTVPGYWRDDAADAANFTDGYWRSGDIGSIDAAGYVRVFDRMKDMINRAGFKIYSVEVENVLSFHPGVVEAAVLGRPDPVLGERVHAFIVPADRRPDPDAIKAYCAERLSDYKVPESLTFLDGGLPRNANGKIQKTALRDLLEKTEA